MAVLSKDEFINRVHAYIGEDSSDDGISFLEDMTDTIEDYERRTGDSEDWERRYKELDETWKKRYKHRFLTGHSQIDIGETDDTEEIEPEEVDIDDLFDEREEK